MNGRQRTEPAVRRGFGFRPRFFGKDRRGAQLVEMAIVFPVFLLFLFVLLEVAYDQLLQTVVESALQLTAYQIQIGSSKTLNTPNAKTFVDNACANAIAGLLNCGSLYLRVQQFDETACTDMYQATSGTLPVSGGVLGLGDYAGEQPGAGNQIGPTTCGGTNTGFCNAGPNEYIILSAVYLAPTFLGGLISGSAYRYNGSYFHVALATSAFYTEGFSATGQTSPC